jgi:hypothetical protein
LHTRYAPVRHSCISEETLPFDLHVLSLPLAFILSQDQTLHCNNELFNLLDLQFHHIWSINLGAICFR